MAFQLLDQKENAVKVNKAKKEFEEDSMSEKKILADMFEGIKNGCEDAGTEFYYYFSPYDWPRKPDCPRAQIFLAQSSHKTRSNKMAGVPFKSETFDQAHFFQSASSRI